MLKKINASVKVKLLSTVLIITLFPLMFAGYLNYETSSKALYNMAVQDLNYITNLKAKEIEQLILQEKDYETINQAILDIHESFYKPHGLTGYGYVLDESGVAMYHLNPDLVNYDTSGLSWAQHILQKKTGYYEYDWEGEMRVASFEQLSNGWIFAITLPLNDLFAPIEPVKIYMFILSLLFSSIAIAVGFFMVGRITKPIMELVEAMKIAEKGDLRKQVTVSSRDEIGQLSNMYNEMIASFRRMLLSMQQVSEQVAASSEELTANADESSKATEVIASNATDIAFSSEKQLQSAEESGEKILDMNDKILSIVTRVRDADRTSDEATKYAEDGAASLRKVIEEMDDITSKSHLAQETIDHLGDRSQSIRGIIATIYDISEQTNLLALNAAIEAARAGEQGKSFAVVANEIRKLAVQSSESASEIAQLIEQINGDIQKAIVAVKENTDAVGDGQRVVITASSSFNEIIQAIEKIDRQIEEVTLSAEEIGSVTEETVAGAKGIMNMSLLVANGTSEIAASAEEQTATMEEIASSSEVLANIAQKLQSEVNKFKL